MDKVTETVREKCREILNEFQAVALESDLFKRSKGSLIPYRVAFSNLMQQLRHDGEIVEDGLEQSKAAHVAAVLSECSHVFDMFETQSTWIQCKACGSTRVSWVQKQTRSADEAMTIFAQCEKCSASWKF